jgi:hypothetical protein
MTKLSAAQTKTLGTIVANGGEMNGWAGQRGFYCNSIGPLTRMGLVEPVHCPGGPNHYDEHFNNEADAYICPINGIQYYGRVRITTAGRTAHQETTR